MDKRLLMAIVLSLGVLLLSELIFQRPARQGSESTLIDTGIAARRRADSAATAARDSTVRRGGAPVAGAQAEAGAGARAAQLAAIATAVSTPLARYEFTNVGAKPEQVTLVNYKSLARPGSQVMLMAQGEPLLRYRLLVGSDTVALDAAAFQVERTGEGTPSETLTYRGLVGGGAVSIAYSFAPDSYVARVRGSVGVPGVRAVFIDLPRTLRSEEADSLDNQRSFAFAYKPVSDDAKGIPFGKLKPGDPPRGEARPLKWVAAKSKYYLVAVLALPDSQSAFSGFMASALPRVGREATHAAGTVVQVLPSDGTFAFEVYAGPQEWRRLLAMGRDFQHANPYGGFFKGIVQPFATIVMSILLWLHDSLHLNYGWVLIIFGVGVRVLLWPLYQSSMRTSMRMQRIQPEILEVQKRYKANPTKQQEEIMRVYKEHGMTPFSPMMGCLPMMLPMPILFALFFVFQNTIEFRGVSFLWLPDISQKDPLYVLPVVMGASMFVLSWIGMRSAPPNPQGKVFLYFLPIMMTVLFLNFASGLNLYYAVQNLAALPQQWLIAKERAKALPVAVAERPQKQRG